MNYLIYIALGLLALALILDKFLKERLPSWVVTLIFVIATILFAIVVVSRRLSGG